jgi:predicted HD superfamily hydrolase involved in NAD metabolism
MAAAIQASAEPDWNGICVRLEAMLEAILSPERVGHTRRVAHTSVALARRFGLSAGRARLAGLAHDWAREWPAHEIRGFLDSHAVSMSDEERRHPMLAHGKVAAVLVASHFGLRDAEIEEALVCHTIGAAGMGDLARVLFVADYIEPGRRFTTPGFRRQTRRMCLACQVRRVIEHCIRRHGDLHPVTKELYDEVRRGCPGDGAGAEIGERHE